MPKKEFLGSMTVHYVCLSRSAFKSMTPDHDQTKSCDADLTEFSSHEMPPIKHRFHDQLLVQSLCDFGRLGPFLQDVILDLEWNQGAARSFRDHHGA